MTIHGDEALVILTIRTHYANAKRNNRKRIREFDLYECMKQDRFFVNIIVNYVIVSEVDFFIKNLDNILFTVMRLHVLKSPSKYDTLF